MVSYNMFCHLTADAYIQSNKQSVLKIWVRETVLCTAAHSLVPTNQLDSALRVWMTKLVELVEYQ